MTLIINLLISLFGITIGYIYSCCYLNNDKFSIKNSDVFKLNKNRILYLGFVSIFSVLLSCLFYFVHNLDVISSLKLIVLVMFLYPMSAIDFKVQKIPNKLLIAAIIVRVMIYIPEFVIYRDNTWRTLIDNVVSAIGIGLFFILLLLIFKNSIGMGDIKLFAVMAFYQGFTGAFSSIFFSLLISFFISVYLLVTKKKKRHDTISFGPSIMLGSVISICLAGI